MKCQMLNVKCQNLFLLFFGCFLLALPLLTFGQGGLVPCGEPGNPCKFCHFFVMLKRIVDWFLFVVVPSVAVLMAAIGGVMMIFAAGRPGTVAKGKSILTSTVIGLVIIFCAWLIVNTFLTVIGLSNVTVGTWNPTNWFTINCPL